jgi:hypothetical protein
MSIPPWVYAALDGFTLGGLLSTGRPSRPTTLFPEEGYEQEAFEQFEKDAEPFIHSVLMRQREKDIDDVFMQALYDKAKLRREAETRGIFARSSGTRRSRSRHAG